METAGRPGEMASVAGVPPPTKDASAEGSLLGPPGSGGCSPAVSPSRRWAGSLETPGQHLRPGSPSLPLLTLRSRPGSRAHYVEGPIQASPRSPRSSPAVLRARPQSACPLGVSTRTPDGNFRGGSPPEFPFQEMRPPPTQST